MQLMQLTDDYFVAPQIQPADIDSIKQAGFTTVICNRPDNEDPGQATFHDIAAACSSHDIECHHIPVTGMPLAGADIARQHELIAASAGKTLAYCRSGQRSAMIFEAGA